MQTAFQGKLEMDNLLSRLEINLPPTIGNICMDMCMLDVSHIENVKSGDDVIIFDSQLRIQTIVADVMDTIPYEIITHIFST